MSDGSTNAGVVEVSRTISAAASRVFDILCDPSRHHELDGSGMLRASPANQTLRAVGDVFVMQMQYAELGSYETDNHVVAFERDRRIVWEPAPRDPGPARAAGVEVGARVGHRWGFELAALGPASTEVTEVYDCSRAPQSVRDTVADGQAWIRSMERTLERLERLVAD